MSAPTYFYLKKRNDQEGLLDNGFQDDTFYYAFDYIQNSGKKQYGKCHISNIDNLLIQDRHIYELLDFNKPVYYKHDIDDKSNSPVEEVVAEAKSFLCRMLKQLKWDQEPEFIVAHTSNDSKTSIHIMIKNLVFANQSEYNDFQNYCICNRNKYWDKNDFNGRNQLVRCLGQSKIGKNPLELYEGDISSSEFIMQCYDSNVQFFIRDWKDIFSKNISKLFPNISQKNRNRINDSNTSQTKRTYYVAISKWQEKLIVEDYPEPDITISDPVLFLLNCIPNPNRKDAYCPYEVWVYICSILANINGNQYLQPFISFSQKCKGVLGDQYYVSKQKYNYYLQNPADYVRLQSLVSLVELIRPDLEKPLSLFNGIHNDIMFSNLVPNEVQSEMRFSEYGIDLSNGAVQILEAQMGAGKSTAMFSSIIKHFNGQGYYIPLITPRISLSLDIYGTAQSKGVKFEHYQINSRTFYSSNRYICQVNSLNRINQIQYENKKVVMFLDECESLISMFQFVRQSSKSDIPVKRLIDMLQKAEFIFLMDAFISQRTIDFIKAIRGEYYYIRNLFQVHKRTVYLCRNNVSQIDKMKSECFGFVVDQMKQGKNVYFVSESANIVCELQKEAEDRFGKDTILAYQKKYPDRDTQDWYNELKEVQDSWYNKKLVATNATITVGVNFDIPHFDICVIYSAGNSSCVRNTIQSHSRIRQLKQNEVYLFIDSRSKNQNHYRSPFYIPKDFSSFARYNNIGKTGDLLVDNVMYNAKVWDTYEQQISDINRLELFQYYFVEKCGYNWIDKTDMEIECVSYQSIDSWDNMKDHIHRHHCYVQFILNKMSVEDMDQQCVFCEKYDLASYEYDLQQLKIDIKRNSTAQQQELQKAISYVNIFYKYLAEDITVDQAMWFYEQVVRYRKYFRFMLRYIYCFNNNKRLGEDQIDYDITVNKIEFFKYFINASDGLSDLNTGHFMEWHFNHQPQFSTIQRYFKQQSFRADKSTTFNSSIVSKINNCMKELFGLKFDKRDIVVRDRKCFGQVKDRSYDYQLCSTDKDLVRLYGMLIKPSQFGVRDERIYREISLSDTILGDYLYEGGM